MHQICSRLSISSFIWYTLQAKCIATTQAKCQRNSFGMKCEAQIPSPIMSLKVYGFALSQFPQHRVSNVLCLFIATQIESVVNVFFFFIHLFIYYVSPCGFYVSLKEMSCEWNIELNEEILTMTITCSKICSTGNRVHCIVRHGTLGR